MVSRPGWEERRAQRRAEREEAARKPVPEDDEDIEEE